MTTTGEMRMDRSYWLREFAGRAMQASYPLYMEGTRDVNGASTALAEDAMSVAETLLSAIERSESSVEHEEQAGVPLEVGGLTPEMLATYQNEVMQRQPDPTTRELVEAARDWRGEDDPKSNYFGDQAARLMRAIIAYDAAHPNPPSDGSVVASPTDSAGLARKSSLADTPSPGTEDAQAGHSLTPQHTTDEALAQKEVEGESRQTTTGAVGSERLTSAAGPLTLANAEPCDPRYVEGDAMDKDMVWMWVKTDTGARVYGGEYAEEGEPDLLVDIQAQDAEAVAKWMCDSHNRAMRRSASYTISNAEPCGCGGSLMIASAIQRAVCCRDCGAVGPWRDDIESAVLAWNRALRRPASPPRALTDTDRELFDALSRFDWSGAARSDQRKRVRKGWDAIRAWLEWYTARRDDPTAALREAYRDACVAEVEAQRRFRFAARHELDHTQTQLDAARKSTDAAKLALDAAQKGAKS